MNQSDTERLYALFEEYPNVSTDSRRVDGRTIFFALRGERFDGNRFAVGALDAGAVYAVIDDPAVAEQTDAGHASRLFVVEDTLKALQALAREHRRRLGIPILAITGSNGKTTTKELVSRVLAERYTVWSTQGNLNNHIGVPLTLLSMTRDTELGIVEMGASACGEIALLASIAEPNFGIITNVGRAHLEGFGGEEGVQRGKGELYDFLAENGGRAFVRSDDRTLVAMAAARGNLAVEFYDASIADGVEHQLEGAFNRLNVAAAMAVGRYFGVADERIRHAIATYVPSNNRSQRRVTSRNTLIVDCYNANPSSMQVSLGNFLSEEFPGAKTALLGDMLELGAWSDAEHRRVIEQALAGNVDRLWLVGSHFAGAWQGMEGADHRVRLFDSCAEAAAALQSDPVEGSLILIKGSRGIGLERLIDLL